MPARMIRMSAAALALAAGAGAGTAAMADPPIAPARDGNIAIRQELDAARKSASVEAYDLFIARHPDHPLAAVARRERERLLHPPRR